MDKKLEKTFEEIIAESHRDDLSIFLWDIERLFSQITSAAGKCFKIHLAEAPDAIVRKRLGLNQVK